MTQFATPPRIGLTLDWLAEGDVSRHPWYACPQNCVDAVVRAGGLPLALPAEPGLADAYLDQLDGLYVTGGSVDVDPSYYGQPGRHGATVTKDRRTAFDFGLIAGALAADLPLFCVGYGHQLLNVVLGGTLIQHIPAEVANALPHEQTACRTRPSHEVAITADTLLARIAGRPVLLVNSDHHQAVGILAERAVIGARAPDGVVEAIEVPDRRFALGVQWAPEFGVSAADHALFAAFVEAARGRA
ncbi:MAG: gamma-glutamyl-gamma-aminobutyrate hydrolase family protein [Pseudomonadota bacterium]